MGGKSSWELDLRFSIDSDRYQVSMFLIFAFYEMYISFVYGSYMLFAQLIKE